MQTFYFLLFFLPLLGACARQGDLTPQLWSIPIGGYGYSRLEGDLLVGYLDVMTEQIAAVDLSERKVIWRSDTASSATFSPNFALSGENTFVFLAGKGLLAYNNAGNLLSTTAPPRNDAVEGGVLGAGLQLVSSRLFVPNGPYLYAYNVTNPVLPELLWRAEYPYSIFSLAADLQGVYVGTAASEANLMRLEPETGQVVWTASPQRLNPDVPGINVIRPIDDTLITFVESGLQAFDRATGRRLWATPLSGCPDEAGGARALEVGGGMAFVSPSFGSCIHGFDLATGAQKWVVATGQVGPDGAISISGQPLYHNGVVYTSVERLWALDAVTGKVLSFASQSAYNTVGTTIHYANGEILVWGNDLTAYKPVR